jgi:hypothetical protein
VSVIRMIHIPILPLCPLPVPPCHPSTPTLSIFYHRHPPITWMISLPAWLIFEYNSNQVPLKTTAVATFPLLLNTINELTIDLVSLPSNLTCRPVPIPYLRDEGEYWKNNRLGPTFVGQTVLSVCPTPILRSQNQSSLRLLRTVESQHAHLAIAL